MWRARDLDIVGSLMQGIQYYCEVIAALKLPTTNKQGRHLSTRRAIELLEEYGVETVQGLLKAPKGMLRQSPSITICRR